MGSGSHQPFRWTSVQVVLHSDRTFVVALWKDPPHTRGIQEQSLALQCNTLNYSLLTGVLPCIVSSLPSLTAEYFCIDIAELQGLSVFFGVTEELGVGISVFIIMRRKKKSYVCQEHEWHWDEDVDYQAFNFFPFFLNSLVVPVNFQHKNFFAHWAIFIIIVITTTSDHQDVSVTRTKDYI